MAPSLGLSWSALLVVWISLAPTVVSQLLPRQTPFNNETSSTSKVNSGTGTAPAPSFTRPPPCCWVIGGTQAVGLDGWWTTSAEETVATVITNYAYYNGTNSTSVLNSTTIYAPANATFASSSYGFYPASGVATSPITAPFALPTNLIPNFLAGIGDYAGTSIIPGTVATWNFTNLRVYVGHHNSGLPTDSSRTSPTPFDEWFGLAILTIHPYLSKTPTTQMESYEPLQCGYCTYSNG